MSNPRFNKLDRVRRLMNEDMRTLASPSSSQSERMDALENQAARRRQRPYRSDSNKLNGMSNFIPMEGPNSRPSIQDETLTQPSNAHGYQTVPGAYQQFSGYNVHTSPKGVAHTGNVSNFGYQDEMGDRERAIQRFQADQTYGNMVAPVAGPRSAVNESKKPEGPVLWLEKNLSQSDLRYIGEVVTALVRQADGQRVSKKVVFERFEQTNSEYAQEHLFMVAHKLGLIQEKYDSTAGQWVVVNPYGNPQTPEQLLYNQRGFSQYNYQQLEDKQRGNYYTHNGELQYQKKKAPQMPPATPQNQNQAVEYSAKNNKSDASLKNPKRGDDYIRNSRLTLESVAFQETLTEDEFAFLKKGVQQLRAEIARLQEQYNKGGVRRDALTKAEKRLKGISNNALSAKARRETTLQLTAKQRAAADAVSKTKMRVEQLHHGSANEQHRYQRAEHAYNRHLNLLESANKMLSKPSGYGLGQG